MQNGAGKRKTLALTAGEVGCALGEARVQPVLASEAPGAAMRRLSRTVPAKSRAPRPT